MVYNVILVIDLSEWMSSLLAATLDKTSSEVSLSMAGTGKTYRLDRQIFPGADFEAMFYPLYCTNLTPNWYQRKALNMQNPMS